MGCNCGKSKARKPKQGVITKTQQVLRDLWEKTENVNKPVNVTKINKK
tara:strand:- start:169 stop:312 length:144 start_codon:yes stop_codon:yes gene_type:complete